MYKKYIWRILIGLVVFSMVSGTALGEFVDNFDGPTLDAAWHEADIKNSSGLISVAPLAGTFQVTGIKQTNPRVRKWVKRKIVRDIDPVHGDFTATMNLSWNQQGTAAMFAVKFVVLSADGDVLATAGLLDGWIAGYAKLLSAVGSGKFSRGSLVPETASADLRIERKDDLYTISMKGIFLASGKGAIKDVAQVAVIFEYYDYGPYGKFPKSHFGTIGIDSIMIKSGVAVSESKEVSASKDPWQMGEPIVSYWAGPAMTDALAKQMADGGWNLVIVKNIWELDIIHKYGLRGILNGGLWGKNNLKDPEKKVQADLYIESIMKHPALYAYCGKDEPRAEHFHKWAPITIYTQKKDPARLSYINLLPMGCAKNNEKKVYGLAAEPVAAYKEYLRRAIKEFNLQLLSFDYYPFGSGGVDSPSYWPNLVLARQAALNANIPLMVFVQACSFTSLKRIPTGAEMRWQVNTSVAYGAQGISYYVYGYKNHTGMMINLKDGSPTELYYAAKEINRDFVAIAKELQPLRSTAVYHVGSLPSGVTPFPANAQFRLDPVVPVDKSYAPPQYHRPSEFYNPGAKEAKFTMKNRAGASTVNLAEWPHYRPAKGFVVGCFGKRDKPSHAFVVNLDYNKSVAHTVVGPDRLEVFDATTSKWSPVGSNRVKLSFPPGGGILIRVAR